MSNFENDPDKARLADEAQAELAAALDDELTDPSGGLAQFATAGLERYEIVNNVRLMISGGINEPRDGVGLVVYELLRRPDVAAAVRADRSVLRRVIEETFRYHSPVGTATPDDAEVTLSGITIPAGEMVAAVLTAANRDPRRWFEPDTSTSSGATEPTSPCHGGTSLPRGVARSPAGPHRRRAPARSSAQPAPGRRRRVARVRVPRPSPFPSSGTSGVKPTQLSIGSCRFLFAAISSTSPVTMSVPAAPVR